MNKKLKTISTALITAVALTAVTPTFASAAELNCSKNGTTDSKKIIINYSNTCENTAQYTKNSNGQAPENKTPTTTKTTDNKKTNDTNNTSNNTNSEASQVIKLVNDERSKNGLSPLKENKELSKVANIKAQDMIDKNYFDHVSPTYGTPFDMMKKFGINYTFAGENIAYGQKTPSEVMNSWMNSEGHRANILNSNYTEIGIGIARNNDGTPYWVQMFINPGK